MHSEAVLTDSAMAWIMVYAVIWFLFSIKHLFKIIVERLRQDTMSEEESRGEYEGVVEEQLGLVKELNTIFHPGISALICAFLLFFFTLLHITGFIIAYGILAPHATEAFKWTLSALFLLYLWSNIPLLKTTHIETRFILSAIDFDAAKERFMKLYDESEQNLFTSLLQQAAETAPLLVSGYMVFFLGRTFLNG